MKVFVQSAGQIAILILFSAVLHFGVDALRLPIPGSVLGLIILFVLLQTKVIRVEWVDLGAKWLLAEMLLFFVPSAVGIVQYPELIVTSGVKLFILILIGTFIVMSCTGLLAQRFTSHKKEGKHS